PRVGHCSIQPGVDLHHDCSDGREPCSSPTCAPPDGGDAGYACGPPNESTLCSLGTCDSDSLHGTGPAHCVHADACGFVSPNGSGTAFACSAGSACAPDGGICKTSCISIGDCTEGYVCNPSGACVPTSTAFPPAPSGCSLPASPVGGGPWGR